MPILPGKNLHHCFSIIKRPQITRDIPSPDDLSRPSATSATTTTNTTSSSSNTYVKNYNSVYDFSSTAGAPAVSSKSRSYFHNDNPSPSSPSSSAEDIAATPDFAAVYASQRFFFSSPGRSNSIIDSSSSSSSFLESLPEIDPQVAAGGVAVQTYSPDPYVDFRRSMQEMVEAREILDVKASWDYLHELLLCYLSLNPKSTHKFIIRAFADLLVSLMSTTNGGGSSSGGGGSGDGGGGGRDSQFPDGGYGGIDGVCSYN